MRAGVICVMPRLKQQPDFDNKKTTAAGGFLFTQAGSGCD